MCCSDFSLYQNCRFDILFYLFGLVGRELKSTGDLLNWLGSAYSYLAMVNYPYPSDFIMPLPGHPIREVS